MGRIFYRPEGAWVGDVIPFFAEGKYQLFYLHDERRNGVAGETPWHLISTTDMVHFCEEGEAVSRGTRTNQDYYAYTGDVIEKDGVYHLFYTGMNPFPAFMEEGKPLQSVMHATSKDLKHWTKHPEHTFYASGGMYERHDWRDPYVFWNEEAGEYWMLLAARTKTGPDRRRGCIALCASTDLIEWEVREPFWAPGLYITHECPEVFQMGNWWYLVYSTFSEKFVTHYRMSQSPNGPWIAPNNDTFDGRGFYAAKTASDGTKRYAFGWIPSKTNSNDNGDWQWAGDLVVHEIVQQEDGTLKVKLPNGIDKLLNQIQPSHLLPVAGEWTQAGGELACKSIESHSFALSESPMPDACKVTFKVSFEAATRGCGLMIRADEEDNGYYIRFEPLNNRLVFDCWPRQPQGEFQWQVAGDKPYVIELERPLSLEPGRDYEVKMVIEDSICVVYIDNLLAMSARIYNRKHGKWGFFVTEGSASFKESKLFI